MRNNKAKVSDPYSFVSNPGDPVHILYNAKVLASGEIRLVPSGKENTDEKIQSYAKYTDITYIMNRLQVGDYSMLREGAVYGDFTKAPKNLAESLQLIIDGERKFDQLPLEVKNKFNNSYYNWIQNAGSPAWLEKMGFDMTPAGQNGDAAAALDKVSEVVSNES